MKAHVSGITLGVEDVERAKRFYAEGLGWPVQFEQGEWVSFGLGGGTSTLGLFSRTALSADAGVDVAAGGGAVAFSYVVSAQDRVDEVIAEAAAAGGTVVKPAQVEQWGGYSGYFADPDGHLWKVSFGPGGEAVAAE
jgi:catechol 2,3-dioxygenase-like lactoylglutathione lyase family enzyme